ncbi:glycosyltransferase [Agarivorans aestuarii]|uniref:glycosyltransferase n=1 Tax=Agarivorans aestuarii TaxID=1563703 RepID=UPI001C7E6EE2|nr:glycosyltransferase [Agarivorans aestuarii]
MSSKKPNLVLLTNLYPLPWQSNRGKFNQQQFDMLKSDYSVSILIPVAFLDWWKHRKSIQQTDSIRYFPYFYTPKVGRSFYSYTMFVSLLLHSAIWLVKKHPQIIVASWAFPEGVVSMWLSRLMSTKFFIKVHGSDINLIDHFPGRVRQFLAAANRSSGVLSVSQALANKLVKLGVKREKIKVIYNGVNHELFGISESRADDDYLLYVGNLKRDKGVIELLKGFAMVSEEFPDLQLVYLGEGGMLSQLQEEAEILGVSSRVHLMGAVEHQLLPNWIAKAKLLALPSYAEGVPNVVLESMASGVPTLATRVGGVPEVFKESVCGKLISPKSADEVANGIRYILGKSWDGSLIKEQSLKFSWENNKQMLLQLLSRK